MTAPLRPAPKRRSLLLMTVSLAAGLTAGWITTRDPSRAAAARPDDPADQARRKSELQGLLRAEYSVPRAGAAPAPARSAAHRSSAAARSENEVPAPVATRVLRLFKHYRAREVYNAETRHPTWAPAMEGQLAARFAPYTLAKFPGLRVSEIECRTSACRTVLEYPPDLRRQMFPNSRPGKGKVLNEFIKENGPIASGTHVVEPLEEGRETAIFFFDEPDIDPAGYSRWAADVKAAIQAQRQAAGATPPPSPPTGAAGSR